MRFNGAFWGEIDRYGGACARDAFDRKPPLMQLHQRIGQRQAEAYAFETPREPAIELLEGLQRVANPIGLHADARVADLDGDTPLTRLQRRHLDASPSRREFH